MCTECTYYNIFSICTLFNVFKFATLLDPTTQPSATPTEATTTASTSTEATDAGMCLLYVTMHVLS